ncbi:MAG: tripartite tricarboxylate transporter substrate-binding protein [Rhodovarius sp.]|nr:tripartite tricarboxylate transporter substrate-binding protein [Rhodovarius sp.]MCX7930911.1 tripartite tricarboxylate transporter substrate-binding protein [Rhodovarius sp.]MDW8313663.1 tripartite tricarboxylate transporter substrate-binding protein [Rhodovarius sp.]
MSASQLDRRGLLAAGASALLAPALARAQASGPRTIRILVGFPPGQATDIVARLWAERMAEGSRDVYIVDNRPGQGGSMALGQLARAAPDGTTMMLAHMSALATNPHLYRSVPYDTLRDFDAVGLMADLPFVLVCNPQLPVRNLEELIRYARANPDRLSNASSGNGTVSHLAMEEFKRLAGGLAITHVPYRGSALGVTDVMTGTVQLALETVASTLPHIQSGRLRALAAGTARRLEMLPDLPTFQEQGFSGFTAVTWLMVIYPAGVPRELLSQTHAAIERTMRVPEMERRLIGIGAIPRYSASPDEAAAYMREEFRRWGEVVRRSGVTLD